jgi:hypothetical protein
MVPMMQQEAAHIWSLYEQGVARDIWLRTDRLGAVYVLESTIGRASCLLERQPLARAGLVDFELIPVGPFTPLALLFGTQATPLSASALPVALPARSQRVIAIDRPQPGVTYEDLVPHLPDEAAHAWSLWKAGVIRENYLRTDRSGAVIVLEAGGVGEARELLAGLPLVQHGLIEFDYLAVGAFVGFDALLDGSLDAV